MVGEAMSIEIRPITDLEADWPLYYALLKALDEHHAEILSRDLRDGLETSLRHSQMRRDNAGNILRLLAVEDGAAIGTGTGRIVEGGWSRQEVIGHLGDFYIRPDRRGSTLVFRMHKLLEDWFCQRGVQAIQRETVVLNSRAIQLWRHLGYLPYIEKMTRPLVETSMTDEIAVRRVVDIDRDWDAISVLLRAADTRMSAAAQSAIPEAREDWHRTRLLACLERNGRVMLGESGSEPMGLLVAHLARTPWVSDESKVSIEDLVVASGNNNLEAASGLLSSIAPWARRKGATTMLAEGQITDEEQIGLLVSLGFEPHISTLRKNLPQ